jgi:hypothetical protein
MLMGILLIRATCLILLKANSENVYLPDESITFLFGMPIVSVAAYHDKGNIALRFPNYCLTNIWF